MPTPTDLVTDLPADFEVFGQAVDTSLADLRGGTTGQVLKKNTNTDMDFVWSADSAGMTNPMTTTGDTIYSSSGSTPARLAIGSTGNVLTVAGGVPTWAAPAVSSSGLVWIGNTSFSASQAINVNNVFSTTYDSYRIIVTGTASSGNPLTMRLRLSGTDTSTNYVNQAIIADDTSTTVRRNYVGTDEWQLGDINADAATFEVLVTNPNVANKTGYSCTNGLLTSSTTNISEYFTGFQTASTQFTGFTLLSASNATGTLSVYGYAKA